MLTKRYLISVKNLPKILQKIVDGTAPDKFTVEHLRGLGFKSSQDRGIIPLLKDLGFLSEDGTPTQRYHDYRDKSRSKTILGEAVKEAYSELFHISEKPTTADKSAIQGKFKTVHNISDRVAELQTTTFFALLKQASYDATMHGKPVKKKQHDEEKKPQASSLEGQVVKPPTPVNLRYNIEIHLPATKDVEVFNAIFKALRTHLGE